MLLARKNYKDEAARVEAQRQKIILYKKFFHGDGAEILKDLINNFSLTFSDKPRADLSSERQLGRNDVLAYILNRAEYPLDQFDSIVKGESK